MNIPVAAKLAGLPDGVLKQAGLVPFPHTVPLLFRPVGPASCFIIYCCRIAFCMVSAAIGAIIMMAVIISQIRPNRTPPDRGVRSTIDDIIPDIVFREKISITARM